MISMIPCYDVLEGVAKFGMISVIDFYIKNKTTLDDLKGACWFWKSFLLLDLGLWNFVQKCKR